MGNVPLIHETTTAIGVLGDVITANPDKARKRMQIYAENSVIGSGTCAAVCAIKGDMDEAKRYGKGMGRATGSALLGGGFLRNVPVLHELATAGDSLGDIIGGGDTDRAAQRWDDYAENSVIGSGVYAAMEYSKGNTTRANELCKNMVKASVSAGVTVAAIGATVVTAGATAPLGVAAAVGSSAAVGAGTNAASSVIDQAMYSDEVYGGDVLSDAIIGGAVGGLVGFKAAKGYTKAQSSSRSSSKSNSRARANPKALRMKAAKKATKTAPNMIAPMQVEQSVNTIYESSTRTHTCLIATTVVGSSAAVINQFMYSHEEELEISRMSNESCRVRSKCNAMMMTQ